MTAAPGPNGPAGASGDADALGHLLAMLELERIELDIFRGANAGERPGRVFGGQVAAQALRAAAGTIDADHRVHSLHAYFLRPGEPGVPIVYQVDRIRDGCSFTTRRVVAVQHGEAIFNLDASFHGPEEGPSHELPLPAGVPEPERLPPREHRGRHHRPMDSREVPEPVALGDGAPASRQVWVRTAGTLPDDPVLHACVLTYLSDMGPVGATRRPHRAGGQGRQSRQSRPGRQSRQSEHGGDGGEVPLMTASLDHAMWFHRAARADEWLLYTLETVSTSGARGLARGTMHTREGRLAVAVAQEALLRPVRP